MLLSWSRGLAVDSPMTKVEDDSKRKSSIAEINL